MAPCAMAVNIATGSTSRSSTVEAPQCMPVWMYDVPPTWNSGIAARLVTPGAKPKCSLRFSLCAFIAR